MRRWSLPLMLAFFGTAVYAADASKGPIMIAASEAKITPGLKRFATTYFDEPFIGHWLLTKEFIDFDLDLEPGKYRLAASIIPEGGGYLLAKVGEAQPIRRPLQKVKGEAKPQLYKFGDIEVLTRGTRLRFLADNIVAPGLCQVFHIELIWVGPLSGKSPVKSPLEVQLEKEKAQKAMADVKAAAQGAELLAARLKGTSWNWYTTNNFKGAAYPMTFSEDGTISLPFNGKTPFKVVDGKTIDIFFKEEAFWRVRFSDDLRSFKSDLEYGLREPKSGRLK